ncbi:hypothetical protein B0H19DRAFT_399109 [Mycena capillaripes]|nr:hypothetical protein B0H19DRAFT_399109 [Mycena capillaripes]
MYRRSKTEWRQRLLSRLILEAGRDTRSTADRIQYTLSSRNRQIRCRGRCYVKADLVSCSKIFRDLEEISPSAISLRPIHSEYEDRVFLYV